MLASKWFFLSTKFKTNSLAHGKKLRALSAMGFSIFLSVFLCKPAGLAVHCENLLFHWWAIMAVCISNKKSWVFSVNEIRIWLLESTNLEFFRWTKYAVWVNLKNSRFFDERSQICLSEPKKLKIFWREMQNAIIANQWIGKFSQ